jgi:hypothetical protein
MADRRTRCAGEARVMSLARSLDRRPSIEHRSLRAESVWLLQPRSRTTTIRAVLPPENPLRQRLIEVMNLRRFSTAIQRNYIRDVGRFARSLRLGTPAPTMNSIGAALRFFVTRTLGRPI